MPTTTRPTLTDPDFYASGHARDWGFRPDEQALFERAACWRRQNALAPAADDERRVHLLIVDAQKDFCFPSGALYVGGRSGTGALDDNDRLARFIYRQLASLSEITCTLDSHSPFQIFFPSFWVDAAGVSLRPYREITAAQIRSGEVAPNPALAAALAPGAGDAVSWLRKQATFYCESLEAAGKYRLYLWPPHCLLGSDGHTLAGVIQEARLFHAFARNALDLVELKGDHPLTENYSVLRPEVLLRHDGARLADRNTALIERLLTADVLIVAGQASSHCVRTTLEDLLHEIEARDRRLAARVYILRDCMSAVVIPDPTQPGGFVADFTPQAGEALAAFAAAGMNIVDSTTPMAEWPGLA